jgi:hypothetical protein
MIVMSKTDSMISVNNYLISLGCMESYPCQHHVINVKTDTKEIMNAVQIFNLLKDNGTSHPHFDEFGGEDFQQSMKLLLGEDHDTSKPISAKQAYSLYKNPYENIDKVMFSVGPYKISKECSEPLLHVILNINNNEVTEMLAVDIYKMLIKHKLSHPYFDKYAIDPVIHSCMRTVGHYQIGNQCLDDPYVCEHNVIDNRTGKIETLSGLEIYNLLLADGHSDKHFDSYGKPVSPESVLPELIIEPDDPEPIIEPDDPEPIIEPDDKDMYIIGDYKISHECTEFDPCCHDVIFKTGEHEEMYGDDIYQMLKDDGHSHEHFDIYEPNEYPNMYKVGNYQISDMCLKCDLGPCQHDIVDIRTHIEQRLEGSAIYLLLKNDGHSHEHFDEFKVEKKLVKIDMKNFIVIGHFKISKMVHKTCPERHDVFDLRTQETRALSAKIIYQLLKDNNYSDPRFPEVKN